MKILCIIKRVPDTAANIRILDDGTGIDKTNLNYVTNPYDEYALESALRLKEKFNASLHVVSVSDKEDILRNALAVGADEAFWIYNENYDKLDASILAKAYAKFIEQQGGYDIVLTGKVSIDDNSYALGGYLSVLLNVDYLSHITAVEFEGTDILVEKETDYGNEVWKVEPPVVLTHERGKYEPRLPNLRGIMQAKRKPLKKINFDELGVSVQNAYTVEKLTPPPRKQGGRILQSTDELVEVLKNEIKIL